MATKTTWIIAATLLFALILSICLSIKWRIFIHSIGLFAIVNYSGLLAIVVAESPKDHLLYEMTKTTYLLAFIIILLFMNTYWIILTPIIFGIYLICHVTFS
jgi:hypothetical protein